MAENIRTVNEVELDDDVQHGIDDNPTGDAEKGAALGGVGGAAVGAAAGAMAGPVGALIGAAVGGIAGAIASGVAVGVVDRVDNDNNVSGVGSGVTRDPNATYTNDTDLNDPLNRDTTAASYDNRLEGSVGVANAVDDGIPNTNFNSDITPVNGVPGIQTGGHAVDGTLDTRGILEKTADTVTGDNIDDKTGKPLAASYDVRNSSYAANVTTPGLNDRDNLGPDPADRTVVDRTVNNLTPGNGVPGVQTGGHVVDGTPDTRGVMEKAADAVTGDNTDDKTDKRV